MSAKIFALKKRPPGYQDVEGVPYLKLNVASGVYYVRKYRAGKGELFRSTGERTKGRAKTRAEEMIAEWIGGRRAVAGRRRVVESICDELLESLRQECKNGDRRPRTLQHDEEVLPVIKRLFGDTFVDEIDEEFWSDWVRDRGRKLNRSLFDIAKYLSKVLTFAYRRKYIGRKPAIRNPDKPSKKGTVITEDEIGRVLGHADEVLLLQIALGYECGMRTGEIRGLRWDMITFEDGIAIVDLPDWFVKANARAFQLSDRAAELLRAAAVRRDTLFRPGQVQSPFVFPAPTNPNRCENAKHQNKRWRRAVADAKIARRIRFYDLRHTFYNRTLLEFGLPVQQVSQYGGTSIRTLQKDYLHADPRRTAAVAQALQLPIREKFVKGKKRDA